MCTAAVIRVAMLVAGSARTAHLASPAVQASVLITGGAGFIGSALSRRLAHSGARVFVMDVLHPQVHGGRVPVLDSGVTLLLGDVTHEANWDAVLALARPDVVVHLAAETGTGQSLSEASRHGMVNVVGTTLAQEHLLLLRV